MQEQEDSSVRWGKDQDESGGLRGQEPKDSGGQRGAECAHLPASLQQTASDTATEVPLTSGSVGRRGQEDAAQRTETWLHSAAAVVAVEMTEPGRREEGVAIPGEERSEGALPREGALFTKPSQPAGPQALLCPEEQLPLYGCESTSLRGALVSPGISQSPAAAKSLMVTKQSIILHRRLSVAPLSAASRRRPGDSGGGGARVRGKTIAPDSGGGLGAARRSRPAINLSMNLQVGEGRKGCAGEICSGWELLSWKLEGLPPFSRHMCDSTASTQPCTSPSG